MKTTLKELLEQFKTYKIDIEGRNESSINVYLLHINQFCIDCNIEDTNSLIEVKAEKVKQWLSMLSDNGNSAKTRNIKLTSVKQFFMFLEDELDYNVDNKISRIKYAKTLHKEVKYASKEIVAEMLNIIKDSRVRAILSVLSTTGIRFSELLQLTCTDIEKAGITNEKGESKFPIIIKGKGGKERKIWFCMNCLKECNNYIRTKRKHIIEKTKVETDMLFISDEGNAIKPNNLNTSLKTYAKKIGLYWWNEMSVHKIRHGFVTDMLNNGEKIQVVRDMVGHSNISTTNEYAHSNEDAIKNAMLKQ